MKLVLALCSALLMAVPAWGQEATVRVTVDRATIWQPNLVTVSTMVTRGAVLEVVLPLSEGRPRRTGFIASTQVETASGTLPPDNTSPAQPPAVQGRTGPAPRTPRARPPAAPRHTSVRAFGDVSYDWFLAHDTFKAIIGQPGSAFIGGGGELVIQDGLFVQGSARWLRRTGERVVVNDDEVLSTGVADTLTIVPIAVTVGYRWRGASAIPYVAGGLGQYRLRETADFDLPTDKVERNVRSYHVLAGVEWRVSRWVGTAVEAQYTHVPDALDSEVADAYNEHNLGGIEARFKIVIGR
jgi:hypothetical protein